MKIYRLMRRAAPLFISWRLLSAYLDPGSGSIIVQVIIAAIVGLLATFRLWKSRLLALFGIRDEGEDDGESKDD